MKGHLRQALPGPPNGLADLESAGGPVASQRVTQPVCIHSSHLFNQDAGDLSFRTTDLGRAGFFEYRTTLYVVLCSQNSHRYSQPLSGRPAGLVGASSGPPVLRRIRPPLCLTGQRFLCAVPGG
jgi:hypothetical protein